MTKEELTKFFDRFKYKQHVFTVRFMSDAKARIRGTASLMNVDTQEAEIFTDHRDIPFTKYSEFDMLHMMRNWLLNMAVHENDEHIRFDGKKVFDPHKVWSHIG